MARPPDPQKRADLLKAIVNYLEVRGVNDLSLAPMAEAIGTSKRMLLYYFGDRQELVAQALAAARPNVGEMFHGAHDRESLAAAGHRLWTALTRGKQRRSVRMLLQVLSLATTDTRTYGGFACTAVDVMLQPIAAAFRDSGYTDSDAQLRATLVVSGLRGLCQDLLVTGDRSRLDEAAALLIATATSNPYPGGAD